MTKNKTIVIYHANCCDGLSAAGISKYFLNKLGILDLEFHAGRYDREAPELSGYTIYFVDFSYKLDVVEKLLQDNDIILIDHHKSAIEGLAPLEGHPNMKFHISRDNTQSGTGLAWSYFNPTQELPEPLKYVQDRDIWEWKYPNSRPYLTALELMDRSLESYCAWVEMLITSSDITDHINTLVNTGNTLLAYQDTVHDSIIKSGLKFLPFAGFPKVPVINCPGLFVSDIGNKLFKEYDAPFVVLWEVLDKGLKICFRSSYEREDVSRIAQEVDASGGGHHAAAGVVLKRDNPKYLRYLQQLSD